MTDLSESEIADRDTIAVRRIGFCNYAQLVMINQEQGSLDDIDLDDFAILIDEETDRAIGFRNS